MTDMDIAISVEPLGSKTDRGDIVWYDTKEVRIKVIWSVAPVSMIHIVRGLPSKGEVFGIKAIGVLEMTLVVGWGFDWDCCNKPRRLWYFYWVKPKDLALEVPAPLESLFDVELSAGEDWEALALFLNSGG